MGRTMMSTSRGGATSSTIHTPYYLYQPHIPLLSK
jgi:hypothetical protein